MDPTPNQPKPAPVPIEIFDLDDDLGLPPIPASGHPQSISKPIHAQARQTEEILSQLPTITLKASKFPSSFLASSILKGCRDLENAKGRQNDAFRQVFGNVKYARSTVWNMKDMAKKVQPLFDNLPESVQNNLSWSGLLKRYADAASISMTLAPPSSLQSPIIPPSALHPGARLTAASPPTASPPSLRSPIMVPDTLQPTVTTEQDELLQNPITVLLEEHRSLHPVDQDHERRIQALCVQTSAEIEHGQDSCSDDELAPNFRNLAHVLRCPFCDDELTGDQFSPALLTILNSKGIQTKTVPAATLLNPFHRTSLSNFQVYQVFCNRHRLEETLLPLAKSSGWPLNPDFGSLRRRVEEAKDIIQDIIAVIQEEEADREPGTGGKYASLFYSEAMALCVAQNRRGGQSNISDFDKQSAG
jgi:hypothetical protein